MAISLLAVVGSLRRLPRPRMTSWRLECVAPIAAVTTWLIVPVAWIVGDPGGDYHIHHSMFDPHIHP